MSNPDMVGPASLALGQSVGLFTALLPKFADIRRADITDELAADVRMGEVAAATVAIGIGTIISSLTGSPIPAFTALIMVFILICVYEAALRAKGGTNA